MGSNEEEKAREMAVERYKKRKGEQVKDSRPYIEDSSVWLWRGLFVLLLPILIFCVYITLVTIVFGYGGSSLLVLIPAILVLAPITILAGKHWNG